MAAGAEGVGVYGGGAATWGAGALYAKSLPAAALLEPKEGGGGGGAFLEKALAVVAVDAVDVERPMVLGPADVDLF